MKCAIVGSRELRIDNISEYIPTGADEIISGGARGVDTVASEYARKQGIKLTEFLPNYKKYGRRAPLVRNLQIIEQSDCVIALWDGHSPGTKYVIDECRKRGVEVHVFLINKEE